MTALTPASGNEAKFPLRCRLPGGEQIAVTLEEEIGKVDLNTASPAVLVRLFTALTLDASTGKNIAGRVAAFRDPDQGNAKDAGASPARTEPNQADKPRFSTIMQLDQIDGVSPRLFRAAAEMPREKMKMLEEAFGALGRGWYRQLPRLAETTCGDEVLTEAGLTAAALAAVDRPVVALYDEFSPFLATCRWLQQPLPRCTAEIIPAAKHLAMLDNTAGFTDAVKRHLARLAAETDTHPCTSSRSY